MSWLTSVTGLFPNAYYIARREYLVRVRNRTFAVITAIVAVVGLALTLLPLGLRVIGGDKPVNLAVVSSVSDLTDPAAALQASLNTGAATAGAGPSTGPQYRVKQLTDASAARVLVRDDELDGLVTITRGSDSDLAFDLFSKDKPTSQRLVLIRNAASQLSISDRLNRAGVAPAERAKIFAPTAFSTTRADPEAAKRDEDQFIPAYALSTVFVILMFMAIQVYGNWVAASVAEEKSSRVMELLISAATPRQLLFGKVLGNGAAGLTQYAVILVAALVGFLAQGRLSQVFLGESASGTLPGVTPPILLGFGVFFISGFVLYSILYAAAGSMVSRQEDVQQVVGVLTFISVGGYLLSLLAVNIIDVQWVRILSFVPFVAPFLFPARMLLTDVAPIEYVLALILMALGILGALWVAARIYAAGVLLYGQRPNLRTMWRAAFAQR